MLSRFATELKENEKTVVSYEWKDSNVSHDLIKIRSNGKYGMLDTSGNLVIPCIYDEIIAIENGLFKVRVNNAWGAVNAYGKTLCTCKCRNLLQLSGNNGIFAEIDDDVYFISC